MQTTYAEAIRRVLLDEGGYTNDPRDPGGPTNWGITIYDARLHWRPHATAADVRAMPRSVAIQIYKAKYWDALRCDELPAGVDYAVFDYGVNSGIGRSGKVLRAVLGLPSSNWHIDSSVLERARRANAAHIVDAICDERLRFLHRLRTWPHFGLGWGRRVAGVKAFGRHLAMASQGEAPAVAGTQDGDVMAKAFDDGSAIEAVPVALEGSTASPETSPVSLNQAPAISDTPTYQDPQNSPSMLTSKSGWAAVGLGGSGVAEGLQQANDMASQASMAKWNFDELGVAGLLKLVWSHPMFLVAIVGVAAAVFVWFDHRKYKRLAAQLDAKK